MTNVTILKKINIANYFDKRIARTKTILKILYIEKIL